MSGGSSPPYTDMIEQIRRLAETLPTRVPSELRVGPHVLPVLRQGWLTELAADRDPFHTTIPFGVRIVPDAASLRPGEWRLLDQWGEPLQEGHLWPPDLPIVESDLLPEDVHAMVFTPPGDNEFGPESCVIVRSLEGGAPSA